VCCAEQAAVRMSPTRTTSPYHQPRNARGDTQKGRVRVALCNRRRPPCPLNPSLFPMGPSLLHRTMRGQPGGRPAQREANGAACAATAMGGASPPTRKGSEQAAAHRVQVDTQTCMMAGVGHKLSRDERPCRANGRKTARHIGKGAQACGAGVSQIQEHTQAANDSPANKHALVGDEW
jgi:hypothetical protein